jgi:hypothetical protein
MGVTSILLFSGVGFEVCFLQLLYIPRIELSTLLIISLGYVILLPWKMKHRGSYNNFGKRGGPYRLLLRSLG